MNAKSVSCPNCGQRAQGNFCSHCGAPLTASAGRATRQWRVQTIAPWLAVGVAVVALVVVLVSTTNQEPEVPIPMSSLLGPGPAGMPPAGGPVDLSSMTPREAADRLFNRVMTASERGDREEALRFVPMALIAYDELGALDNDARYHVALIQLVAGDTAKARMHVDSLRKAVPGHLLASMLEHQIAERDGNREGVARAYRTFLAAYDAEIAVGRTEYQDHRGLIDRFREAASRPETARAPGKKGP